MKKQEAEAFFKENRWRYNETGSFKMALHGALDVLNEVNQTLKGRLQTDENQKTGTLLVNCLMNYASQITEWIDFAAEHPELEIAVTGAATFCNSGEAAAYAWYSPAGSPELEGTEAGDPIGGCFSGEDFGPVEDSLPFPGFVRTCRFSAPLGSWKEEDHDGGWVAVWENAQGDLGHTDLLDREGLERYGADEENPVPPKVAAAAELVSKLEGLEDGPEGEEVILELWKILFPEANIRVQREDDRCRFLDDEGGEYFLAYGSIEPVDGGAFFGEYVETYMDGVGTRPLDWGFPARASWLPEELFTYEELNDGDGEEDW